MIVATKFWDRPTFWTLNKSFVPRGIGITEVFEAAVCSHDVKTKIQIIQLHLEYWWHLDRCPYYNVYTPIARMLANTSLKIPCEMFTVPHRVLVIRFPEHDPLPIGGIKHRKLRSMMIGFVEIKKPNKVLEHGLGVWLDRGETGEHNMPVFDYQTLLLKPGISIEESLTSYMDHNNSDDPAALQTGVRIAVGISLIARDPELVIPDVLVRDADKQITDKLIDRAHRRGKIGWIIGRGIEISPHIRRPHFGLRWTGEGGKIPKLVPIKGSIVHKSLVENVPTGTLGN
jgi:hypothetical protein